MSDYQGFGKFADDPLDNRENMETENPADNEA